MGVLLSKKGKAQTAPSFKLRSLYPALHSMAAELTDAELTHMAQTMTPLEMAIFVEQRTRVDLERLAAILANMPAHYHAQRQWFMLHVYALNMPDDNEGDEGNTSSTSAGDDGSIDEGCVDTEAGDGLPLDQGQLDNTDEIAAAVLDTVAVRVLEGR